LASNFFLNNFEKEKIINDIEKKFEIKINEKNKTKINIFPIVKLNTNLEIKDYKNNLYFDNIRIDISQPVFQVSGNLNILIDNLNINNINFSEVNINGKVNYIENYLKYSDNLENLFDSIYKINGKITLKTTNEEKFLISFLKLFFEKLENQKNQLEIEKKQIEARCDTLEKENEKVEIFSDIKVILDTMDHEERIKVVEMLWGVVLADENIDDYEANLMRKISSLLHVSSFETAEAKKRAMN